MNGKAIRNRKKYKCNIERYHNKVYVHTDGNTHTHMLKYGKKSLYVVYICKIQELLKQMATKHIQMQSYTPVRRYRKYTIVCIYFRCVCVCWCVYTRHCIAANKRKQWHEWHQKQLHLKINNNRTQNRAIYGTGEKQKQT